MPPACSCPAPAGSAAGSSLVCRWWGSTCMSLQRSEPAICTASAQTWALIPAGSHPAPLSLLLNIQHRRLSSLLQTHRAQQHPQPAARQAASRQLDNHSQSQRTTHSHWQRPLQSLQRLASTQLRPLSASQVSSRSQQPSHPQQHIKTHIMPAGAQEQQLRAGQPHSSARRHLRLSKCWARACLWQSSWPASMWEQTCRAGCPSPACSCSSRPVHTFRSHQPS